MALLKYLQRTSTLPNPQGPLSRVIPSSSVAAANEEVKRAVSTTAMAYASGQLPKLWGVKDWSNRFTLHGKYAEITL